VRGLFIGVGILLLGVVIVNVWLIFIGLITSVAFVALNREPRMIYVAQPTQPEPVPRGGGRHILVQSEPPRDEMPMPWEVGMPLPPSALEHMPEDMKRRMDPFRELAENTKKPEYAKMEKWYEREKTDIDKADISGDERDRRMAKLDQQRGDRIEGIESMITPRDYMPIRGYGEGGPIEKLFWGFPINIAKIAFGQQPETRRRVRKRIKDEKIK
jgi:hypothetical protein